jgi:two-component system, NtrC family, nitrogen regulation sensor histidine kinase NtrY
VSTVVLSSSTPPRRRKLPTDMRLFLLVLSSAIPVVSVLWPVERPLAGGVQMSIVIGALAWILAVAYAVRAGVLHHIRTLSNLIEATRAQDYSMKSTRAREPGELSELYQQISALAAGLQTDRQSEQELLSILEKVVGQINVAIVVCDSHDRIRLVNLLACTLLKSSPQELVGLDFASTPLADIPLSAEPRLLDHRFPGGAGRWQVSQQDYRHQGRQSRIIFIADLKQVLSEEEIAAWQRLIRVISHEVNNSLTPITSLCQTLTAILAKPDSTAYANDVRDGLSVIAQRAKGLKEFISVYARIARLPQPQKVLFPVAQLLDKVSGIFDRSTVRIVGSVADVQLFGDPVHLEQALINLIKNALDANNAQVRGASAPAVELSCAIRDDYCEFAVVDHGAGISNPDNLFVPFYTTKNEGAGVGLVLCRQIAARHFGDVTVENRTDGRGAVAKLVVPLPTLRQAMATPSHSRD